MGHPHCPMGWGSSWLIWHTQEDVFSGLLAPARVPIGVVLARNLPITLLSIPRPTLHRFPSGEHHGQHLPGCAVHLPGRGVPREPHLPVVLGGGERLLQEVSLGRRLPLIPCRGCPRSLLLLLRRSPPPHLSSPGLSQRPEAAGADPDRRDADHFPGEARGCWKIHLHPEQQPGPLAIRLRLPDGAV